MLSLIIVLISALRSSRISVRPTSALVRLSAVFDSSQVASSTKAAIARLGSTARKP